jgi:hypothetical protein
LVDFCGVQTDLALAGAVPLVPEAYEESDAFKAARSLADGQEIPHGGHKLKTIKGMGSVYDWRTSPWTPANGGKINPLVFVQHIPVVPNLVGIADFIRLRDVLVAQGLMVQSSTDREGNVALFTPFDILCYQARGANQLSCGCEHMHLTIGEDWSKKQLRAAAWLVNLAKEKHGIPAHWGKLGSGAGVVRVAQRGSTSHEEVSIAAGFNDRSDPGVKGKDPGGGYDREYVYRCVTVWRERIKDGTADSKGMEGI